MAAIGSNNERWGIFDVRFWQHNHAAPSSHLAGDAGAAAAKPIIMIENMQCFARNQKIFAVQPPSKCANQQQSSRAPTSVTMFESKLISGSVLKKVVDAVKDLVTEANIEVNSSGMSLQSMDSSHVSLTSLNLRADAFEHWRADRPLSMGTL